MVSYKTKMLEKIERLRKLQKESHAIVDEICESLAGKCRDSLIDVLESILENVDEFPDSEGVVRIINEFTAPRVHKKKKDKGKKEDDA